MKKLTQFAVNYPVTILMVVSAVVLLGYISFDKLGIDLFPEINNPRLFIEIKSGERPPEEMEKQFVENLEALAIRQSDVVQVSSVSKVGTAQITVEYAWTKDMDEAFLDLQKASSAYAQNQDIDEINITQHDPKYHSGNGCRPFARKYNRHERTPEGGRKLHSERAGKARRSS